ncbi:MAG: flagellar hook-basal body complex protein FliE [Treponema sp.]|nr:flagellar hook-basal body complex protein FliE [Treponema sp.]
MKIPEFGTLQMVRTDSQHYGVTGSNVLNEIKSDTTLLHTNAKEGKKSFQDFLFDAMNEMNSQQLDVASLEQQIETDPDSVDIHDVTIAMSKARMSLNLAQTVIDRLVTGWNEISTTR